MWKDINGKETRIQLQKTSNNQTTQFMCLVFHLTPRAKWLSQYFDFGRVQNYLLIEGNLKIIVY